MKKILFLAAVTAVVLSSCSKNEVTDSVDSTLTPIGFTSYAGSATKATAETGFVSTDVFVVDAYYTAGSDMEDATGEGATLAAFMQDQTVTYGGSAWTYSPIKYWPNNTDDQVSFFAVTDASSTKYTFNDLATSSTTPSFTITDPSTDIMIASVLNMEKPTDGSGVEFTFVHTMAQVNFTAALAALATDIGASDKTEVTITSLTVDYGTSNTLAGEATFTFSSSTASSGDWATTTDSSVRSNDVFNSAASSAGIGTVLTTTTETTIGAPLMILPNSSAAYTVTVVYSVATTDYDNSNNNSTISNTCEFEINPKDMNTNYTYDLSIGLTAVSVTGTVSDWSNSTTESYDVPVTSSDATAVDQSQTT